MRSDPALLLPNRLSQINLAHSIIFLYFALIHALYRFHRTFYVIESIPSQSYSFLPEQTLIAERCYHKGRKPLRHYRRGFLIFQNDYRKWATGVRFGSSNTRSIVIGSRFEEFLRMIASGALFRCFLPLENVTAVTATP